MQESAFECVAIPDFPTKPRESGLTMVMDYGLGRASELGLLEASGQFIDMAKMATGVSRVLPAEVLRIPPYRGQ